MRRSSHYAGAGDAVQTVSRTHPIPSNAALGRQNLGNLSRNTCCAPVLSIIDHVCTYVSKNTYVAKNRYLLRIRLQFELVKIPISVETCCT